MEPKENKIRNIAQPQPRDYDGATTLERWRVKCHNCNHVWTTISDAWKVTCPSCSLKTDRIKPKQEELNNG